MTEQKTDPALQALEAFLMKHAGKAERVEIGGMLEAVIQSLEPVSKNGPRESRAGQGNLTLNPSDTGMKAETRQNNNPALNALEAFLRQHAPQPEGERTRETLRRLLKIDGNAPGSESADENVWDPGKLFFRQENGFQKIEGALATLGKGLEERGEYRAETFLKHDSGTRTSFLEGVHSTGMSGKTENVIDAVPKGNVSFEHALKSAENQVIRQVSVHLFSGVRQGSGNMMIQIHPPELGSVKVKIISEQGSLSVHLHPQNQQVAAILERHLPALHQSLVDQGIDLSWLQVSVDSGTDQDAYGSEENGIDPSSDKNTRENEPALEETRPPEDSTAPGRSGDGSGRCLSLRV
ncbi:MAG: flagellar hook-length control protein FliK [Deltaproteobacteria bacterium]|nr:flagellar hook-length control protein FliK [Deltaproteobacteria bacterium]